VQRRSAAQFTDDEKTRHADYVIDNSGSIEDTEQQLNKTWPVLQQAQP
jgi:dephospho-CoA kinase